MSESPDGVTEGWVHVWSPNDADGGAVKPYASAPAAMVTLGAETYYLPRDS